ncbi:hypothetical protein GE21DRAFT_4546 [Neurospora crassa]|uniref:Uncharacterized protein n=1 Tax=Neurospora crassa (strain ATCC 24698 / 74-OR23-1A / CBS 708.71 / DSM 1257 / FGSC 987) TaxID=367110 RepID=Q7RZX0_NEUCR|nr:hypothetical protein NCU00241 [Neurospora crassa OR74A]EAA28476.1 hypothetical protein NCU00241 [Neurospora crassa OR74A]KHE89670.1 hypothetical protein GE21DRAFT_4546 [Neurospora crassa]|eukprot:XP_957712.1 hypothetical protein NCU00241 [Neurospora crassa OR74A]
MDEAPPPPPPPHGKNPKTSAGSSALPPRKYDVFIIPEHSAGAGFLYLPSLQPQWNSFFAGVISTLAALLLRKALTPAFLSWWHSGMGSVGLSVLLVVVAVGSWSLGRSTSNIKLGSGSDWQKTTGESDASGAFKTAPPYEDFKSTHAPPPRPPTPPTDPETPADEWSRPSWKEHNDAEPEPHVEPEPEPEPKAKHRPQSPTQTRSHKRPQSPTQTRSHRRPQSPIQTRSHTKSQSKSHSKTQARSQPRPQPPPEPELRPEDDPDYEQEPVPEPPRQESVDSQEPPHGPPTPLDPENPTKSEVSSKGAWEKAREETRRREEERKAREAELKRRDDAARRLRELRERDAREREKREKEAREKEERERERKEQEALEKECLEREIREKVEQELRQKAEWEAKELAAIEKERLAREREAKERERQIKLEQEARQRERERLLREQLTREREAREREAKEREEKDREAKEREVREAREREELRQKDEAIQREEERKRFERDRQEAKDREVREAIRRREREAREAREAQEQRDREERLEQLRREDEEMEKEKERLARKETPYAMPKVGERTSLWPNGRPPSIATPSATASQTSHASTARTSTPRASPAPPHSPTKSPNPAAARTASPKPAPPRPASSATGTADEYSYRPYDKPKNPAAARKKSISDLSEDSYAQSATTNNTSPPPSMRAPYHTDDPGKIVIKAVYNFVNHFSKTPASQLISGVGTVTDGLILRISTAGLFVDDDVRGVAQREWDIKAWTLKQVEVWCPVLAASSANGTGVASGAIPASHPLFKMMPTSSAMRRAAEKAATRAFNGEEAVAYLNELGTCCSTNCRLGLNANSSGSSATGSAASQEADGWKFRGLHLLRTSIRDQEGKRFLFVVGEEEAWKIAKGLQSLRSGSQARAVAVSGFSGIEAKGILETLGWS